MPRLSVLLVTLALIASSGCASVRPESKAILMEARELGLRSHPVDESSPALAATLNILPGIGNIYLASTSEYKGNWGLFALNLLLWPASVVWGIPQAGLDAATWNEQASADYYQHNKFGKAEMEKARAAQH